MEKNPIVNNRIVHDKTFALRLRNFIKDVHVSDPASEEEKGYLLAVAKELLHYQVVTLKDPSEKTYLMNNNVIKPKRTAEELKNLLAKIPLSRRLRVTHIKSGKSYIVSRVIKNCTNAVDGQEMVLYIDVDSNHEYLREINEFIQKFEW
jgi:hypothetical protein